MSPRSLLPLLLLAGCTETELATLHFDGPVAAAVLPEAEGPFTVTSGYVANLRGGTVVPLDLVTGRFLSDDPFASFLRSAAVPFGDERILADVAVVGTPTTVDVWTVDNASGHLLWAPYVIGVDEAGPREVTPVADVPVFFDGDASGDTPTLEDLQLRAGFTTTEDWSVEFDGERWWAFGSRSGKQDREPIAGEPYHSDNREVEFTLTGTATVGDRFDFHTETGVREIDLGGRAVGLLHVDDRLFVALAEGRIVVLDAVTGAQIEAIPLEAGTVPGRMVVDDAGALYVADTAQAQVHVLTETGSGWVDTPVSTAAPVVDLAWSTGESQVGTPFAHLFVAPLGLGRVDVYDTAAGLWWDPNPATPAPEGIPVDLPITGIAASAGPVRFQVPTEFGAWPEVPVITVATAAGIVYALDASSGCYLAAGEGPKGPNTAESGTFEFTDVGAPSDPGFLGDSETGDLVAVSSCPGVTFEEDWGVTYDGALLAWRVEGSRSGVQTRLAYDDQRYVSDTGAVSFLIASGSLPPSTGDRFAFATEANLLSYTGSDPGRDATDQVAWSYPARPMPFALTGGPTGGGWDPYEEDQYALLPVTNTDIVALLRLDEGLSDSFWR